uniref:Uncharacterized protein n=1 Tax=Chenopodium quinoa TaxID=63459 RepID=A0A803MN49_CHEQI
MCFSRKFIEVERACPPTIKIDQWKLLVYNYWSSPKQRELEAEAASRREDGNEVTEINASSSNVTGSSQANDDPMYLKLWDKSKRHKNGKFDDEAEVKFNEFRQLHEKEIGEKGVDNLTLEEAYVKVLGHRSGYARGLGKGHPLLAQGWKDRKG